MLTLLGVARVLYPRPQDLAAAPAPVAGNGLPRVFWIYLGGAALAAAGFADSRLKPKKPHPQVTIGPAHSSPPPPVDTTPHP